jgi:hypothetical protein
MKTQPIDWRTELRCRLAVLANAGQATEPEMLILDGHTEPSEINALYLLLQSVRERFDALA